MKVTKNKLISIKAALALTLGIAFASGSIVAKPTITCVKDPIYGGYLCCDDTQCHIV